MSHWSAWETAPSSLLRRNIMRQIMIDAIERQHTEPTGEDCGPAWRIVVSAWLLVFFCALLLAGVSAVAGPRSASHHHLKVAGATIPQHDPCSGLGVPSAYTVDGCTGVPLNEYQSLYR
jgi:hypothetical protein